MTNTYEHNVKFEKICVRHLMDYFYLRTEDVERRIALFPNTREMRDFQRSYGDAMVIGANDQVEQFIEFKCERKSTGNLFIETHSNLSDELYNAGWLHHLKVNRLWYYFADENRLLILNFQHLKTWLFKMVRGNPRLMTYREACQAAHRQKNLTVGRLVPIADLPKGVVMQDVVLPMPLDLDAPPATAKEIKHDRSPDHHT